MPPPIALQLYTVRDQMKNDFVGTLKQVSKIGYAGIEGGGPGPLSLADYKKLLADLKLIPISTGAGIKSFQGEAGEKMLAQCRELGTKYAMIGYEKRDSAEGWKAWGREITEAGKTAKAGGLILQYHNHAHEFEKYDGKTAHEIIFENADRQYIRPQIDVGWVQRAGQDPVAVLRRFKDWNLKTIHVKDTTAPPDPKWIEVGNGTLPVKAVHAAAQEIGVEWYIVEQDDWDKPSIEAAAISFENLKKVVS